MEHSRFYSRSRELSVIDEFLGQQGSGFTYLRGRRRIGKSTILKYIETRNRASFYFQGLPDSGDQQTRRAFANAFSEFSKDQYLTDLKEERLSWPVIFKQILKYAQALDAKLLVILDEIQWIAKSQSGFLGFLKQYWPEWYQSGKIKLIVSGSSSRFFSKNVHSADAPLRGLSTYADIWVEPFSLRETAQFYFPSWSKEEICLVDMMLGGVPYYLENIPSNDNFIRAINEAIFQQKTIFLNEVDEILNLEFSFAALKNTKQILSAISCFGLTEEKIVSATGLSQSTVSEQLNKLLSYRILKEQSYLLAEKKGNRRGAIYEISDPYLVFYFEVIQKYAERIRNNKAGLLFDQVLGSKKGCYIQNFMGKAFESLVSRVLERRSDTSPKIFEKLGLISPEYYLGTYLTQNVQFDLLIDSEPERELRLVEVKWLSGKEKLTPEMIQNFAKKQIDLKSKLQRKISRYLCTSLSYDGNLEAVALKHQVKLIFLEDLF